ncbi:MAG: STAS domain-containing protein, partial [Saprospiraceae bacterium]
MRAAACGLDLAQGGLRQSVLREVNHVAGRGSRRAEVIHGNFAVSSAPLLNVTAVGDTLELRPTGSWTVINANLLESLFNAVAPQLAGAKRLRVDLAGVREIDTIGAWLLEKVSRSAEQTGRPVTVTGVDERHAELIEDVRKVNPGKRAARPRPNPVLLRLEQAGRASFDTVGEVAIFLQM